MNLEEAQSEMQERQKLARSKTARKNAGNRKRKRTRVTLPGLIIDLIQDRKVTGQVRLEALRLLAAMKGKLPEETHDEEPKPEEPRISGADLGAVIPRATGIAIPVDPI